MDMLLKYVSEDLLDKGFNKSKGFKNWIPFVQYDMHMGLR